MNRPPCPSCGTPASLGDAYATDLMPVWRYYLWKLNPLRLIRRKTLRWTTVRPTKEGGYIMLTLPENSSSGKMISCTCYFFSETGIIDLGANRFPVETFPDNTLWYGPIPLPTSAR